MAIFASTTTSGYSDPMKAMSIKALEERMKAHQAQMAQQQPDAAMMSTIPGGIGHVLGVVGDKMAQGRNEQMAAEGRNELAATIAQGPRGADGNWSPEQLAVMARRDPEQMSRFFQNQHERGNLNITERGLTGRADAQNATTLANTGLQNTGRETTAAGDRASAEKIATLRDAGDTARTGITTSSAETIADRRNTAEAQRQTSGQEHDVSLATHNAKIAQLQKERDQAFTAGQSEKAQAFDKEILGLKNDFAARESGLGRTHDMNKLNQAFANDSQLAELNGKIRMTQIQAEIAARSNDTAAKTAAEERLQDLRLKHDERKQQVQIEADEDRAEDAASHKYELQKRELASAADIAEKKIAAEERDPKKAGERLALQKQLTQKQLLVSEFERAEKDIDHPGGIHTGSAAEWKPGAQKWLGIGSKAKAERSTRVYNAMDQMATASMADTLTGPSTNFELQKFITMKNNKDVGFDALKTQFKAVLAAQRKDKEATEKAVTLTGGDARDPTKPAAPPAGGGGGGAASVPRPAGKNDSDLIAEAKAASANATPEQKAAIDAQLQKWLMGK